MGAGTPDRFSTPRAKKISPITVRILMTTAGALNAENGNVRRPLAEYYQQALAKNPDYKAAKDNLAATANCQSRGSHPVSRRSRERASNNDTDYANLLLLGSATSAKSPYRASDTDFFRFTARHLGPRDYYRISKVKNLSTTQAR